MRGMRRAWPGLALAITFVDDFVAGPILATTGAWVGGRGGVAVGVVAFTTLVGLLVTSAVITSRWLDPRDRVRIDTAVRSASRRRFVGRFVQRVGDHHPWSTALVAVAISPVLAVLLARMVHPTQGLVRTTLVAIVSYGAAFSLFYTGLGAAAADLIA